VERDRRTDESLAQAGWEVVRVWEHEEPIAAADRVEMVVRRVSAGDGILGTGRNGMDQALDAVVDWFDRRTADPAAFFGLILRQAIDEVLDGPRTGRWDFKDLEKTEKTYVGTKLEILLRARLGLERASPLDLEVEGHPVDVKWAMNSGWQIPREAVGELCICIGGLQGMTHFQVGVVRCIDAHLNSGANRDGKRTLSTSGRAAMSVLVEPQPIPANFVAAMDPAIRATVMAERTIQARVTCLFSLLPRTPIPRDAIRTVARTEGDPMRRLRADTHAGDPLRGMKILSSKYGSRMAEALGYESLPDKAFMSVPQAEIDQLPEAVRQQLGS
jgi:hypothetical protein